MKTSRITILTCALSLLQLPFATAQEPATAQGEELPWAFKAPEAEGYSIDLVSISPEPGTALVAGTEVEFKVRVKWSMTVAHEGTVLLVFQDERDRSAKKGDFVAQPVTGSEGELTLTDKLLVPTRAKELRLFVPIMPQGISTTTGELTFRYPIREDWKQHGAPKSSNRGRP